MVVKSAQNYLLGSCKAWKLRPKVSSDHNGKTAHLFFTSGQKLKSVVSYRCKFVVCVSCRDPVKLRLQDNFWTIILLNMASRQGCKTITGP